MKKFNSDMSYKSNSMLVTMPKMFQIFLALNAGTFKFPYSSKEREFRNPLTEDELTKLSTLNGKAKKAYVKELDNKYAEYRLNKLKATL